jgi:hypothetical protein
MLISDRNVNVILLLLQTLTSKNITSNVRLSHRSLTDDSTIRVPLLNFLHILSLLTPWILVSLFFDEIMAFVQD